MRGRGKRWLLGILAALMVVPLLGCLPLGNLLNPPALTREYAVGLVLAAGVPYIDQYFVETVGEEEAAVYGSLEPATAFGTWDATYEGKGEWKIIGSVTTKKWGECLTTWVLSESDSELRLIGFECE